MLSMFMEDRDFDRISASINVGMSSFEGTRA